MEKRLEDFGPLDWLDAVINAMPRAKDRSVVSLKQVKEVLVRHGSNEAFIDMIMENLKTPVNDGKMSEFCKRLGVRPQAPYAWRNDCIPEKWCKGIIKIAEEAGINLKLHDLRPDKWNENDEKI